MLQPDLAGRELRTELVRGLLTAAFEVLELRQVTASCNADNVASARVLEKNGMRREQHGIQDSGHAELGGVDGYQYALLRHEWRSMRSYFDRVRTSIRDCRFDVMARQRRDWERHRIVELRFVHL